MPVLIYTISGTAIPGATISYTGTASGQVTANSAGAYTIGGLGSGSYTLTPSLTGFTFSPSSSNVTISGASVSGINFSAATPYSVPDCRNYGNFPNVPVNTQLTLTYTTPSVDSRAAGAPVDSRVAGAPVDSRVSSPKNCRTNPPFED